MRLFIRLARLALIGLLLFSCGQVPQSKGESVNREQMEQLARIKLPPSSQDIEVHTESGIDTLILLRFTVSESDLKAFLIDAGYTEPLKSGFHPFSSQEIRGVPWWNPDDAKDVMGGFMNTKDWASEIMVDVSRTQPIVYLKAFDL